MERKKSIYKYKKYADEPHKDDSPKKESDNFLKKYQSKYKTYQKKKHESKKESSTRRQEYLQNKIKEEKMAAELRKYKAKHRPKRKASSFDPGSFIWGEAPKKKKASPRKRQESYEPQFYMVEAPAKKKKKRRAKKKTQQDWNPWGV